MRRRLRIQSQRLPGKVSEDIEQYMMKTHHNPGSWYLGEPVADHGDYIGKISTRISKMGGTYFLDVG